MSGADGRLVRQTAAETLVHQNFQAETQDREDHTFSGIMFDVRTRNLPCEYLEIESLWVRGDLGPMTVWTTEETYHGKHESEEDWEKVYAHSHAPSMNKLRQLSLNNPIRMKPDESRGIYIHSGLEGDESIVYDNQRKAYSHRDLYIDIMPGMAHLSNKPFSPDHQFDGWWGSPWRVKREFVGRIEYGVRWLLWNPEINERMPPLLRQMAWTVFLSRHSKCRNSPLHCLENDMIYYILNKVQWWENSAVMEDLIDEYMEEDKSRKQAKHGLKRLLNARADKKAKTKRSKTSRSD